MLRLLSDEDFNGHIVDGVRRQYPEVDLVRAQDVGLSGRDGADDLAVLAWAARENRILLTNDRRTMIAFARKRVADGLPMPGVFALRPRTSISDAIEAVAMVARTSDPAEWRTRFTGFPSDLLLSRANRPPVKARIFPWFLTKQLNLFCLSFLFSIIINLLWKRPPR